MFLYLTYSLSLCLFSLPFFLFPSLLFPLFRLYPSTRTLLDHHIFICKNHFGSWFSFFPLFFIFFLLLLNLFFFFFGGGVHCCCGLLPLCLWCGGRGCGVGYLSYSWLFLYHVCSGHSHAPHADCVLALINWSSTEEKSACLSLAHSPTYNLLMLWSSDPTASLTNNNTKKKEISVTC